MARGGSSTGLSRDYAGSSPDGSGSDVSPALASASAAGSEGIDGGSGAVIGSAGSLLAEEPESPRSHCITLSSMRAMLQGSPSGRQWLLRHVQCCYLPE